MHTTNEHLAATVPLRSDPTPLSPSFSVAPLPISSGSLGLSTNFGLLTASGGTTSAEEAFEKNLLALVTAYEAAPDREEAFAKALDGKRYSLFYLLTSVLYF
jgi:hypothetical protein